MTLRIKLALLFVLLLLSVTPILAQATDEPTPAETPAPVVTTPPVQADDPTSWQDVLLGFVAGMVTGLAALSGGLVYGLKVILSSPILKDVVSKLADSIPPEVASKLLQIATDFKEIGASVTELLTEDVPPVPVGQNVPYKQE